MFEECHRCEKPIQPGDEAFDSEENLICVSCHIDMLSREDEREER